MHKAYESELPEGYTEAYTMDAGNKKLAVIMNLTALVLTVGGIAAAYVLIRPVDLLTQISILRSVCLILGLFSYIVFHELIHGLAYKLLTRRKLKFGLTFSVAYCGIPDIYVYRSAAMTALLAPFVVFLIAFLIPAFFCPNPLDQFAFGVLLSVHVGGCVGDLYDTLLYLFRFRDSDTLMRDTGPKQTFYTK